MEANERIARHRPAAVSLIANLEKILTADLRLGIALFEKDGLCGLLVLACVKSDRGQHHTQSALELLECLALLNKP